MPTLPTSDLRSEAKAYKRDKDHGVKWRKGGRPAPGKGCNSPHWVHQSCGDSSGCCTARPQVRDAAREHGRHFSNRATISKISARNVFRNDLSDAADGPAVNSDNSSDDEVRDPSAAPVPEHEVMYSYDAYTGPTASRNILSNAVTQAVKRFENQQTEKLVKNEYDLVLDGTEEPYAADVEDDFEFVEHAHLA